MKYRIVDEVDTVYNTRRIIVRKQDWFDRILFYWEYVNAFAYSDDKMAWPHRNRVEALAEARKLVEMLKSGKKRSTETVIQDV